MGGRCLALMLPNLMLRRAPAHLGVAFCLEDPCYSLDSSQMGRTAIPPGDRGEQLIANLILSSIAYQFDALACARVYAAQARAIALALHDRNLTYRPPRPSRFFAFVVRLRRRDGISAAFRYRGHVGRTDLACDKR